jgi:hypothetical protein
VTLAKSSLTSSLVRKLIKDPLICNYMKLSQNEFINFILESLESMNGIPWGRRCSSKLTVYLNGKNMSGNFTN